MSRTAELAFVVSVKSELDKLQKDLDGTRKKLGQVGGGFTNTKKVAKDLERGLLVMGGVLVAGVAAADKMAMTYEASMQKIHGLVGISQTQVDAWSKQLLALGPQVAKGPTELADALYYVASAGLRGSAAISVLDASARASAAGLGSTSDVANAVTSAVNAYGIKNLSAAHAVDILTAAVTQGKMKAEDLTPVLGNIIPMASRLKVSFDQITGAIAVMSRTGLDTHMGAVSLNSFFTTLLKGSKNGDAALAAHNLSYAKLRATLSSGPNGLINVMKLLNTAFKGHDTELVKVIPNIRALRGVMNVLSQDTSTVKGVFDATKNSTGNLDRAFQSAAQTAQFKYDKALSQLQSTSIEFGAATLPMVTRGMKAAEDVLANLTADWNRLTPAQQEGRIAMGEWAAGIAAVGYISVKTATGLIAVIKAAREIKVVMAAANASVEGFGGTLIGLASVAALPLAAIGIGFIAAAGEADDLAAATHDVTTSTRDLSTATRDYKSALDELTGRHLDVKQSDIDLTAANNRLKDARKAAADALRKHGADSKQYAAASKAVAQADIDQQRAALSNRTAKKAESAATVAAAEAKRKEASATDAQAAAQQLAGTAAALAAGKYNYMLDANGSLMQSAMDSLPIWDRTWAKALKVAAGWIAAAHAADRYRSAAQTALGIKYAGTSVRHSGVQSGGGVGYAIGGIPAGPTSGYPVLLHGMEAVLPLNNPRRYMQVRQEADRRMGVGGNTSTTVQITNTFNIPATINSDIDIDDLAQKLADAQAIQLRAAGVFA
jgi:TP901 family phage tail tape measure protein